MAEVKTTCREELLAKLREDPVWDVVVIGGGATGAGIAVDAASRGLKTVVLEAQDFSSGTSSRSTKLIHGGVRYMKNPRDWGLVREALKERRILIKNAPHLVHSKPFILPCYKKGEREFYTIGLGIYSAMTYGGYNIGHTSSLSREDTLMRLPGVKPEGLMGGVQFFDGQFDDARLDVALIRTAYEHGAVPLNYMPVVGVTREGGMIRSVTAKDMETGEEFVIRTKMVFNAAGAWVDPIRRMVDPDAHPARQVLHARRHRHAHPEDPRRPRALRHSLARHAPRRHDRRGTEGSRLRSEGERRRNRLHDRDGLRLS